MKVAVLTLTRDRLEYTKHCFATLRQLAGCDFDHFVLDQASADDTLTWLLTDYQEPRHVLAEPENIGISRGMNKLLDYAGDGYDVYVTFDNDCEVTMLGTLWAAARIAHHGGLIVSPQVRGLMHTPQPGKRWLVYGEPVGEFYALGGIFRAMPTSFVRDFRFNESNPTWGGDENDVGQAARARGIGMGYLLNWSVNHYRSTVVQNADYPAYYERKLAEIGA